MKLVVLLCSTLAAPSTAWSADVLFAGSGALDYRFIAGPGFDGSRDSRTTGISGAVFEVAQKTVFALTENTSISFKMCLGCHGLEVDQANVELHATDFFNLRAGRINVPVGEFNVRHDPANYSAPSKPLPYAMGDMLRYRYGEFNLGIVPAPYSDNGLEVFGRIYSGDAAQVDYAAYAVQGLAGTNDIDFVQSRDALDNNGTPALGVRLVASSTLTLADDTADLSVGASASGGTYDRNDALKYMIVGFDLFARWSQLTLRAEVIGRRTDFDPDAGDYRFVAIETYFLKIGYYAQVHWQATEALALLYRFDGLERRGMPLPSSQLVTQRSGISRNTIGVGVTWFDNLIVKLGYEYWHFYGTPFDDQHAVRTSLVYSF